MYAFCEESLHGDGILIRSYIYRSRITRGAPLGNMLKQLVIKKCMSCY